MNIKLKALLTVVAFFSILVGLAVGISSIPDIWIKKYGLMLMKVAILAATFIFGYYMALDYYKADKEIKELEKEREESNKKLDKILKDMEDVKVF